MSEISDRMLSLVQPYLGRNLETRGRNDGPVLDVIRRSVSPWFDDNAKGAAWCGMLQFWLDRELTGLDRGALTRMYGFDKSFAPESCDSWRIQATRCPRPDGACLVKSPEPYDLVLWYRRLPDGTYDRTNAVHIARVMPPAQVSLGHRYPTFEGNTCPEHMGDGKASREGNCMAFRSRPYVPAGCDFIRVPTIIKDCYQ